MVESYSKYTYDYWEGRDASHRLVPDALLDAFIAPLSGLHRQIDLLRMREKRDATVGAEYWPQAHTMSFVREIWAELDESYKRKYDFILAQKPVTRIPADDVPYMASGGRCTPAGILFRFNESLSDPVYMAHESGHLMATAPTGDLPAALNIAEFQAYFMQEAAYDILAEHGPRVADAVRLHRFDEFAFLADAAHMSLALLKKDRPADFTEDMHAHYIHYHPFAACMMAQGYAHFKVFSDGQKRAALDVLYGQGDKGGLADILGVFGVDVAGAAQDMATLLRCESRYFGVTLNPAPVLSVVNTPG